MGRKIPSRYANRDFRVRLDLFHYNEGHPVNNHRDGYGLQLSLRKRFGSSLSLEGGIGPYYSMNTTTKEDRIEYDDKKLGYLATLAALFYFRGDRRSGHHLRLEFNEARMPGGPVSRAFLIGIGKDYSFDEESKVSNGDFPSSWIVGLVGISITNHGNRDPAINFQIERWTRDERNIAFSVSGIIEGDDQVKTDREGIALQVWYVQPLSQHSELAAGVGPYLAINHRTHDEPRVNAITGVRYSRKLGNQGRIYFDFSRVVSNDNNDRDLFRIGYGRTF